jgi:hypothetical protein
MLWRTGAFPAMKMGGVVGSASPRHFYTSWSLFLIGCTKAIKLIAINFE